MRSKCTQWSTEGHAEVHGVQTRAFRGPRAAQNDKGCWQAKNSTGRSLGGTLMDSGLSEMHSGPWGTQEELRRLMALTERHLEALGPQRKCH